MEKSYKYKATAYWILARRGIASAEGVPQSVEFSSPPEFEGERELWTPEHFLMTAVASCFVSTFRAVAEANRFDAVALDVIAEGTMTKEAGGYRFTEVTVRPILTVATDEELEKGRTLLDKTERICPITRSLSCSVAVVPVVQISVTVAV